MSSDGANSNGKWKKYSCTKVSNLQFVTRKILAAKFVFIPKNTRMKNPESRNITLCQIKLPFEWWSSNFWPLLAYFHFFYSIINSCNKISNSLRIKIYISKTIKILAFFFLRLPCKFRFFFAIIFHWQMWKSAFFQFWKPRIPESNLTCELINGNDF